MHLKRTILFALIFPVLLGACTSGTEAEIIIPERGTHSQEPARERLRGHAWEDGFMTGNGHMGALMMGDPSRESLWLSHAQCFRPLGSDETVPDFRPYRDEIRKLAREGGSEKANEFFKNWIDETGWELKWTDPFRPALNLEVVNDVRGEARYYIRTEDFATGELGVQWHDDAGRWQRRLFVSRADEVIVLSLKGPGRKSLSCLIPSIEFADMETPANSIESEYQVSDRGKEGITVGVKNIYVKGKGGYNIAIRMKARGGSLEEAEDGFRVKDSDELLVLVRIDTWKSGEERGPEAMVEALCELPADYGKLFARHEPLHRELFERSSLDLGATHEELALSGEALIRKAYKEQELGPVLAQKLYDAGRYMLICAGSDRNPPNLQGIWTGTWETPFFSGDYTMDANVQCAIASAYSTHLPEMMTGVFHMLEGYMDDFRTNASHYYGCRGIMLPSRISNTGVQIHWNKGYPGHLWHAGAAWFGHFFIEHWKYFGDEAFLREHTMPYLEEVVAFYEDFMWEDDAGRLNISPAYSAEMPMGQPDALGNNPTQDVSAVREILSHLVLFSRMLEVNGDKVPHWESMLEKLPGYDISADGVLKEYADPANAKIANDHRHNSPLYPLFVTREFDPVETPELWAAAMKAVEGKHAAYDWASGFGLSQVAASAAYLERADIFEDMINLLSNTRMVYPSMLTSHNRDYHAFNTDASGNFPDLVTRGLVYSEPGRLDLLPALPASWPKGEIRGILARQQIEIDSLQWDVEKKLIHLSLISGKDQQVDLRVRQGSGIRECKVENGESLKPEKGNDSCLLSLEEGVRVHTTIEWK